MKNLIALSALVLSASIASAKPVTPQIDCSKAAQGEVTIKTVGDRLLVEKAAQLAYSKCLSQKNQAIVDARKAAIAKSQEDESPTLCGHSEPLQSLILKNWRGERPYPSEQPDGSTLYSVGGDATILVREPISCDGIGTGMYFGIVQSISVSLAIEESATFDMEDESKPIQQSVTVKFERLLDL